MSKKSTSELGTLMNVGPATEKDFAMLGITSIAELANADADELYLRIQNITGTKHDPCVWDVFAATIIEAKTGVKQPWWQLTKLRKQRQADGTFCV